MWRKSDEMVVMRMDNTFGVSQGRKQVRILPRLPAIRQLLNLFIGDASSGISSKISGRSKPTFTNNFLFSC